MYRKPIRTAATTLTLAGAASALGGVALADPQPSTAEVRDRVDALHHEAEVATEEFNAATEAAAAARRELDRLTEEAARRTDELNRARDALGSQASAEYRAAGLPASVQLALSSDPDEFLGRAAQLDRSGDRQARALLGVQDRLRDVERLRAEAEEQATALEEAERAARDQRERVESRLAEAERLLATLSAGERAAALAEERSAAPRAAGDAAAALPAAPGRRAAQAVAFAYAQLGKPYGWGATGPDAYDCSGLTQAAWRAAGVSLPRTSYSQADAGTRVSRDALRPGDLVFYYPGLSHVGMYVGDGQIVHASRPGAPVRLAPVDSMPLVAAVRPG
ncbi:C40 family peptidase [Streptomyces sp. 8K308]|uniref:C40 family peptidase n=1 Tax=Streptomyces sp. 8K308 TaxID=2530388 RepID=UPI001FB6EC48|nr:C40 family peptidase [Streptomyces sp. 8K308]